MTEVLTAQAPNLWPVSPEAFAEDPFAVLTQQSRILYDVYHDPLIDETEKSKRLDEYFRNIEALDRATFPDTASVEKGVPSGYIPDGFIDMGAMSSLDPSQRYGRPMNYVDTYNILRRHKAVFEYMFANAHPDMFGETEDGNIRYQQLLLYNIAYEIDKSMPHGEPISVERGGILPVSAASVAKCQQSALTAQVLAQAFGVRLRLSKNYLADQESMSKFGQDYLGGDHVSNVVDTQGKVYMYDTFNPQVGKNGEWTFGLFRMDQQLPDGSWLVTEQNGDRRKYLERNDMYWIIRHPSVAT